MRGNDAHESGLSACGKRVKCGIVKEKYGLPVLLMLVFALTRWPGVLPENFSAVYGLVFCAGVYFPRHLAWWLPLITLFLTDICLNWHYDAQLINGYMLANYGAYAGILLLARFFSQKSSWFKLCGGGLLGAILFYLITNSLAWLQNPEYAKTLAGWIQALTTGVPGFPHTWQFFLNTLASGGLFTGLFAGAMKLAEATEPQAETEKQAEAEPEAEAEPGAATGSADNPAPEEAKA